MPRELVSSDFAEQPSPQPRLRKRPVEIDRATRDAKRLGGLRGGQPDHEAQPRDLTGDGVVDGADLAGILGNWGVLTF